MFPMNRIVKREHETTMKQILTEARPGRAFYSGAPTQRESSSYHRGEEKTQLAPTTNATKLPRNAHQTPVPIKPAFAIMAAGTAATTTHTNNATHADPCAKFNVHPAHFGFFGTTIRGSSLQI
jgi:hypothetical protein